MTELAIREMKELAQTLGVSALLPANLRGKPADVLVTVMYGNELGLSPMAAIQGIYVVNGRPTLAAQTWLALTRRHGHKVEVVEHTDQLCAVKIVRGDTAEEHISTYTYAEAQQAKLTGKDVWQQHRKAMLLARAVSQGCRFICPEIALGFYAEGELDDDTDPIPAAVAPAGSPAAQTIEDAVVVPDQGQVAEAVADLAREYEQPTLDAQ
jgi:hypothetical protein